MRKYENRRRMYRFRQLTFTVIFEARPIVRLKLSPHLSQLGCSLQRSEGWHSFHVWAERRRGCCRNRQHGLSCRTHRHACSQSSSRAPPCRENSPRGNCRSSRSSETSRACAPGRSGCKQRSHRGGHPRDGNKSPTRAT